MKTEEDEAFDDLARRQGMWGGGYQAKRAAAADKQEPAQESWRKFASDYERGFIDGMQKQAQSSVDKAVNMMAQPAQEPYDQTALELCNVCGWKTLIPDDGCLNCERKEKPIQQEAIYGMNQDDWKDVVAAITKVRDGRGIYLGCRPADVFQEWFLALGTAKVKEKNG